MSSIAGAFVRVACRKIFVRGILAGNAFFRRRVNLLKDGCCIIRALDRVYRVYFLVEMSLSLLKACGGQKIF